MSEAAREERNIVSGYYKKPYAIHGRYPRSRGSFIALINSYDAEDRDCKMGYKKICELLNISRSTAVRTIRQAEAAGEISRVRMKTYTEYHVKEIMEGGFERVCFWLYRFEFNIGGVLRKLTKSEIDIYSEIYTKVTDKENREKAYYGSAQSLSAILKMCPNTVIKSLRGLMKAELIYRQKATSGHEKSRYTLNTEFVRRVERDMRRQKKRKAEQAKRETEAGAAAREELNAALDARAERERYYARLRAAAEGIAEDNRRRAFQNPEYKLIDGKLSDAERRAARAEAFGAKNLSELQEDIVKLKARKSALLSGMDMSESDLRPQYRCKKCSDTGFLPNGRACDCYHPKR